MTIMSILGAWATRRKAEDVVAHDADSLLEIWGETAYDVASNLSWREDAGLMHSSSPGHWARVHQEIGRRLSPGGAQPSRAVVLSDEMRESPSVALHPVVSRPVAAMSLRGA